MLQSAQMPSFFPVLHTANSALPNALLCSLLLREGQAGAA